MDNSQSSDVFSDSERFSCDSPPNTMTEAAYETLVQKTKMLLSRNLKLEVQRSSFASYFSTVLNNCKTCVMQSLDQVISVLSEVDLSITQLYNYLDNTVAILRLLCGFITSTVTELVTMNCVNMRIFPTCTGKIILTLFSHCKDSESIYGHNLKSVERQLKDLFRSCHELQLTYLRVLEKQFAFDLAKSEELDVLVEALEINLQIGEIVQTLDVKTMAEQWKAYTMICEKYSQSLKDQQIYENCTKVLCLMIQNNFSIALEVKQEEKIIIRSLKVASFTIKILMRVCNIFKISTDKNYDHILELLLFIYQYNPNYLESLEPPLQCVNSINNIIFNPTEILVKELLQDEKFVYDLSNLQADSLHDDQVLSYGLLLMLMTKYYTAQEYTPNNIKRTIIDCIFKWLPHGHIWFNLGLKFKAEGATFCLYEHVLTHTFALACTLTSIEMCFLEQKMYESVLGIDCYCALFSTNLWELLAKASPRPFVYTQILSLCKTYKQLEKHYMFARAPQKVHLIKLIGNLFRTLHIDDKIKVYKLFDPTKGDNIGLWTALRLESLGCENNWSVYEQVEKRLRDNLKERLNLVLNPTISPEDFDSLIILMKLIATGTNVEPDQTLEDYVIQAWSQLCPKTNKIPLKNNVVNLDSVWWLEYIEALATLTQSLKYIFSTNENIVKVLHVVSGLIDNGPLELKLILINLLFNTCRSVDDENRTLVRELHLEIFKKLLLDTDNIILSKMCNDIRKRSSKIGDIIDDLYKYHRDSLQKPLKIIIEINQKMSIYDLQTQLTSTFGLIYTHKCLEHLENEPIVLSDSGTIVKSNSNASNNFDFVDMDTLFETESDSEPASKRVKLDPKEAEAVIKQLEKNTSLLCQLKENVISSECKIRIRDVCEKLLNIIE